MPESFHCGVFFICPIGDRGSSARRRSDAIANGICQPLARSVGLQFVRADQIVEPGIIIKQVLGYLLYSDFVVADLSGGNPNVMYELAVRHVTGRPCLCLGTPGEKTPYDIAPLRVFPVDDTESDSIAETCRALIATAKQILDTKVAPESPLSAPPGTWRLRADPFAFSVSDFDWVFKEYGELRAVLAHYRELKSNSARRFFDAMRRGMDGLEAALEVLRKKSALPSLDSYIEIAAAVGRLVSRHPETS